MTVGTAHVVVTGSTTRENVYVFMTRGAPPEPDEVSAHTVLYGVLQHRGGKLSAHRMIVAEQERSTSIAQLGSAFVGDAVQIGSHCM